MDPANTHHTLHGHDTDDGKPTSTTHGTTSEADPGPASDTRLAQVSSTPEVPSVHTDPVNSDDINLSDASPATSNTSPLQTLSFPMPSQFYLLFQCLVCSSTLVAPTTLHCGHTICSRHVRSPPPAIPPHPASAPTTVLPSCPLPSCASPPSPSAPNIPSSSGVTYRPAPATAPRQPAVATVTDPKVDVSVSKLLGLLDRARAWANDQQQRGDFIHQPLDLSDQGTDNEDDDPPLPSSSRRPHSSDDHDSSPPQRPYKRRRHLVPPNEPPEDDDLLSHLRTQSAIQRTLRADEPLLPPAYGLGSAESTSRFEKELLTELTCEICFMLLYQPVTTPCQHVRRRLSLRDTS